MTEPMNANVSSGRPGGRSDKRGDRHASPRPFVLIRHHDPSGISGTGEVAEGVVWSDGSVSLRWHGEHAATTFWEGGLTALLHVHGHNGATEVMYVPGGEGAIRDGPKSFPSRW
jgi:hypothetical protein